jgi:hypothetical protein
MDPVRHQKLYNNDNATLLSTTNMCAHNARAVAVWFVSRMALCSWECALAPSLAPATCFACVQQEGLTKRPGKGPLPKALRRGLTEGFT